MLQIRLYRKKKFIQFTQHIRPSRILFKYGLDILIHEPDSSITLTMPFLGNTGSFSLLSSQINHKNDAHYHHQFSWATMRLNCNSKYLLENKPLKNE